MPLPCSFVVKNGSKMRAARLVRHARAGVRDVEHGILPGRQSELGGSPARRARRSSSRSGSCRRRGIASRALTTRLRSTCSSWPASATHGSERSPGRSVERDVLADRCARSIALDAADELVEVEHARLAAPAAG